MRAGQRSCVSLRSGLVTLAAVMFLTLYLAGCSVREPGLAPAATPGLNTAAGAPTAAPGGIDAQLWRRLNAELARVVAQTGTLKRSSAVPQGAASAVPDFSLRTTGPNNNYTWSYRQQGDYDLNGVVNASDLVQIGIHWGQTTLTPNWLLAQLADGDGNGAVGLSDVTAIGLNFGGRIDGYELQWRQTAADPWVLICSCALIAGQPQTGRYPQYNVIAAAAASGPQYRVAPYVQDGADRTYGTPSNLAGWDNDFGRYWTTTRSNITRDGFALANGPGSPEHVVSVPLGDAGYLTYCNEPVADSTGTIYIGTALSNNLDPGVPGWLYAVRLDGTLRWRFRTRGGICGSPSCSRQAHVVVGDFSGMVYSFAPDGKLYWQRQISSTPALTAPLLADDGTVYIIGHDILNGNLVSSTLYRLSATGELDWSRELGGVSRVSPVFDPQGNITVINANNQLLAYTPAGVVDFQFAVADPMLENLFTQGLAIQDDMIYYATNNKSLRAIAYNNSATTVCDLAGDAPLTMPALNILGDCIAGSYDHTLAVVNLKYFTSSTLTWKIALSGDTLSNIATDIQGRNYVSSYISTGPAVSGTGVHCIRQDQTKDWTYATGEKVVTQLALVADNHLACAAGGPDGFELMIISGN